MLKEQAPHVFTAISENLKNLGGPISLDIDAVTQATFILSLNRASHLLRRSISKVQLITYWELAKILKTEKIPDADEKAKALWNNHDVYLRSPKMPGIATLLKILSEANIQYIFISSRPVEFLKTTREWFSQNLPWVKPENVILGRQDKELGGDFKAAIIRKYGVTLHIEDALEEAEIIAATTQAGVLIVPQPWNIGQQANHPRIKQLDPEEYGSDDGSWPVVKFLASQKSKAFLSS